MFYSSAHPGFWTTLQRNLNFFRIHLLFFTFTPLLFSAVLYASNGRYPIRYIDALFNSVSATTVCGLTTVNLSQLTPWQQVLLFMQMCVGSPVVVSWFMVYIRRHFFAKKFEHVLRAEGARGTAFEVPARSSLKSASSGATRTSRRNTLTGRVTSLLQRRRTALSTVVEEHAGDNGSLSMGTPNEPRTDMIHRVEASPQRVDPSGLVSEGTGDLSLGRTPSKTASGRQSANRLSSPVPQIEVTLSQDTCAQAEGVSSPTVVTGSHQRASSRLGVDTSMLQLGTPRASPTVGGMPRSATVEFAPGVAHHYVPLSAAPSRNSDVARGHSQVSSMRNPSQPTTPSIIGSFGEHVRLEACPQTDFGGFPMPHKLLGMLFRRLFPGAANRLCKSATIPITTALSGGELGRAASITGDIRSISALSKPVSYLSFDAIVGRNSSFRLLTNEQLEELGGVEYRGLNALLWLVALYPIGCQLVAFAVISPYIGMPMWGSDFVPPALIRPVAPAWFSLFQVVSAWTNTGMSLVDQSMVPFQKAYPMVFLMIFLILAGNTAFPIFLRLIIWTIAKLVPTQSRLYETFHFLLDHPRRCFVYLFPSHQTWFLVIILLLLNGIDFLCFMVLDVGNAAVKSIPLGTRFAVGLFQSVSVRSPGFVVVPVAALAPAVQVMYMVMMYISVYPIAMSVRSTNVYEEQSLGIFRSDDELAPTEHAFKTEGSRMAMWGRYLTMHARHQLSFDMWWLALAFFFVCIIEKDHLIDPQMQGWFNFFSILFEIVSAYGSVGLSLGIPTQNYSLSGAFRPLSKLILCLVMLRGRHRGLPVAIDRAVVLPYEFERAEEDPALPSKVDELRSSRYSVVGTMPSSVGTKEEVECGQTTSMQKEQVGKDAAAGVKEHMS